MAAKPVLYPDALLVQARVLVGGHDPTRGGLTYSLKMTYYTEALTVVIEQRSAAGEWGNLLTTRHRAARQWTGAPASISPALPFRVVYNTAGQTAVSYGGVLG